MIEDLVYRLKKRAEIRRQITDRKSVQEGKPDRIADLLEEAAQVLEAPVQEPVVFKIYKPTPPRGAIPNVRDAELPWVYDQDPSSGNVASMWVTPVKATPQPQREWVGLTDEEIQQVFIANSVMVDNGNTYMVAGLRAVNIGTAIEAKLKELNHVN